MSVFKQIPFQTDYAISPFREVIKLCKFGNTKHYTNHNSKGEETVLLNGITYKIDDLLERTWGLK